MPAPLEKRAEHSAGEATGCTESPTSDRTENYPSSPKDQMYRPEGAIHHVLTHQQTTYPATRLYALPREEKVQ